MTRFVAALLIARGQAVVPMVDPAVPGCAGLGPFVPGARLDRAFRDGRHRRAEGVAAMERLGREAWRIHRQRGGPS